MSAQTSPHPDWALKHKQPKTELRHINGYYYDGRAAPLRCIGARCRLPFRRLSYI